MNLDALQRLALWSTSMRMPETKKNSAGQILKDVFDFRVMKNRGRLLAVPFGLIVKHIVKMNARLVNTCVEAWQNRA